MNRILGVVSAALLALLVLVPVAAAADPFYEDGRIVVSTRGDITLPAGEGTDTLIVIDGTATVAGDAKSVVLINSTATFVGSHTDQILAIASRVSLDSGSVVTGDVRTINSTVSNAPGSTIQGSIKEGLEVAQAAVWIGPALFIAYLGFVAAVMAAAIALAGLASRQVRSAEELLSRETGMTLLAGFGGILAIVGIATLATITVVGIPLGLALLVGFLPLLAFVGYLVAAIWIGEWLVGQVGRGPKPERPYLAAIVGTLAVSAVSFVPVVGGVISFLGFGAVVLLMWRVLRSKADHSVPRPEVVAAPVAG
jgi:hypothetical protein